MLSILEKIKNSFSPIIENLWEMATVGRDSCNNVLMQVNPDVERQGLEYFKFYNAANSRRANKVARIEFRRPKYVIHKSDDGKTNWFLNGREKAKLIEFLKQTNSTRLDLTNWRYAIMAFNNEKGLDPHFTEKNLLSSGKLKYPKFLPFDLPMPDYTQLHK